MERYLSLSILEYERELAAHLPTISKILENGAWLHIDVMRPPFIPGKEAISEAALKTLINTFLGKATLDIHLMVPDPTPFIAFCEEHIPVAQRGDIYLCLHRESCRPELNGYEMKGYDLTRIHLEDEQEEHRLREADHNSLEKLNKLLRRTKTAGFKTGMVLEPGTTVESIPASTFELLDMVVLMSVHSGKGGQRYLSGTDEKIDSIKAAHPELLIEIDGGINTETIGQSVAAGADAFVIGSAITRNENPVATAKLFKELLNQ